MPSLWFTFTLKSECKSCYYLLLFIPYFFFLLTLYRYASPPNHMNRRANLTNGWKEQLFLFSGTLVSLENFYSRIFWNAPTGSPKSRFSRFPNVNLHLKCMHSIHMLLHKIKLNLAGKKSY